MLCYTYLVITEYVNVYFQMGVIHDRNQSCFIKGEKGYCENNIEGTSEAYDLPIEEGTTQIHLTLFIITR